MKKFLILLAKSLILLPALATAQSIDFGRGELPARTARKQSGARARIYDFHARAARHRRLNRRMRKK